MDFRFAHLADYAGEGAHGKLIMVGIFDLMFAGAQRPIVTPRMHLVAVFEAHVTEGSEHTFELRLCDEDGGDFAPRAQAPLNFVPQGPDRPLRANLLVEIPPLQLPDVGTYAIHVFVDGREMVQVPLYVVPIPGSLPEA